MARTGDRRAVEPPHAGRYVDTARTFLAAATALETIADEDESYGTAIALLAVHAAISFADAVAIAYGGQKSTSGDHLDAVRLLRAILNTRLPNDEEKRLTAVIGIKDAVAYQGRYYPLAEASAVLGKASQFALWADRMYQERPG